MKIKSNKDGRVVDLEYDADLADTVAAIVAVKTPTWKQLRESLPAGVDGEAAKFIRLQTAEERHQARIVYAAVAALRKANEVLRETHNTVSEIDIASLAAREWSGSLSYHRAPAHALLASVLCQIESTGTGGPGDMGGPGRATVRADWAHGLGKGRSQASDGPAWTAAIEAAGEMLRGTVSDACAAGLYEIPASLDEQSMLILIASPQARSAAKTRLMNVFTAWRNGRDGYDTQLAEWAATFNKLDRLCKSAVARASGLPAGAATGGTSPRTRITGSW